MLPHPRSGHRVCVSLCMCPGRETAGLECGCESAGPLLGRPSGRHEPDLARIRRFIILRVRMVRFLGGAEEDIKYILAANTSSISRSFSSSSRPRTFTMNVTTALPVDGWAGYAAEAQKFFPSSTRLALLCLINVPVLAVILNVLKQLVRAQLLRSHQEIVRVG